MNSTSLKQNGSGVSGRLDRPLFCFVFLVILATLFRIALPFFREYIYSDTVLWIRYADQIRHLDFTPTLGEAVRPVECLFQYPPGYSLFIALFSLFLRDLILSSLAVSFFFGVINPFLVYLIGKKVGNRYVGFLAGVIACFHHVTVKISCNSLIRTTVSFFFLLAILALFKFLEEPEKKRNGLLLGTAIFAVYLCRFELGILYGLILVLFILYYFLKNGMKEKTRSILFVFLPLLFLFLVHSFLMFKFTGRFLSEYLVGHVKPVAALNRGISEAFGGKRPPSPYPALEREPSYFREARGKMEHVPFYRKCLETVDSFFESYEMILVILFIILSLKFREIRLGYRYEELFYGLFVLTLFFFAAFVLVLRTRYLFQLLYLVFILYSRLILFLAEKLRKWKPGAGIFVVILLLLPFLYKGYRYNAKSIEENTLKAYPFRPVGKRIRENHGEGHVFLVRDPRYVLFSRSFTYICLKNNLNRVTERARITGARLLVVSDREVEEYFPLLEPIFNEKDDRFRKVFERDFKEEEIRVKVFRICLPEGS